MKLAFSERNSDQSANVIVNKEYFFANRDTGLCKNIHTVKQVLKETAWFQKAKNCRSP